MAVNAGGSMGPPHFSGGQTGIGGWLGEVFREQAGSVPRPPSGRKGGIHMAMDSTDRGIPLRGLMMDDLPLTTNWILRRAAAVFGDRPVVTRTADGGRHRYTYREMAERAGRLAGGLAAMGVGPGDRVATLAMNHHQHLEAYFGVPGMGGVLHTVNPRLHPDDLVHIMSEAGDRVVVVDQPLWPVWEQIRLRLPGLAAVVVEDGTGPVAASAVGYEAVLARGDPGPLADRMADDHQAAVMCYTSGTTGRPKGVVYSHRSLALHALAAAGVDSLGLSERDMVLPVVPMFHVNAWGLPYGAALHGAGLVLPGHDLSPVGLLTLLAETGATITAGVPTIWLGILAELDAHPGRYDLSRLHTMLVGGAAVPAAVLQGLRDRHGLTVLHAWGMTETTPLGSVARVPAGVEEGPGPEGDRYRLSQGRPAAMVEARARGEAGLVPWDGATPGELEVRGPWVAAHYYGGDDGGKFTEDGWFKTGDVVTIDARGYLVIRDRAKDLVKSGGEWISSVALENALMGHPAVAEAAVIAVPHPRWQERPLAVLVARGAERPSDRELASFLGPHFADWWLPDAYRWVDAIPRTATGKFLKTALRAQFQREFEGAGKPERQGRD